MPQHVVEFPSTRIVKFRVKRGRIDMKRPVLSMTPALVRDVSAAEMPLVALRNTDHPGYNEIACLDDIGLFVRSMQFTDIMSLRAFASDISGMHDLHYPRAFMGKQALVSPCLTQTIDELRQLHDGYIKVLDNGTEQAALVWSQALEDAFVLRDGAVWQKIDTFTGLTVFLHDTGGATVGPTFTPHLHRHRVNTGHTFGMHEASKAAEFIEACGYTQPTRPGPNDFDILDASALAAHTPSSQRLMGHDINDRISVFHHLNPYLKRDIELPLEIRETIGILASWPSDDETFLDALVTACHFGREHRKGFDGFWQLNSHMGHFADRWALVEKPLIEKTDQLNTDDETAIAAFGAF